MIGGAFFIIILGVIFNFSFYQCLVIYFLGMILIAKGVE